MTEDHREVVEVRIPPMLVPTASAIAVPGLYEVKDTNQYELYVWHAPRAQLRIHGWVKIDSLVEHERMAFCLQWMKDVTTNDPHYRMRVLTNGEQDAD